ncbi:MotE family protein [Ureibacillus sp. GCM10028918]|uniref:MotE family protein n=1 Tax=Ureibacillus sp. GCM10028918 TaxID=3273429 RepID=UPI003623FDF4
MAKGKAKQENTVSHEGNSPGIFQKLIFWFIIPLLFIVAILLVVATFTNFNVFEKAAELTNLKGSEEEVSIEDTTNQYNEKIVGLEAEVKEKEAEIEKLQSELESAKAENQESLTVQEQLQYEIEKLQRDQTEAKKEFEDLLDSFEQMSAKSAAPILVEMSDEEAVKILASMQPDILSAVLAKMSPADAARYTELLSQ